MKYVMALLVVVVLILGLSPFWALAQFFSGAQYWASLLLFYAAVSGLNAKAK